MGLFAMEQYTGDLDAVLITIGIDELGGRIRIALLDD